MSEIGTIWPAVFPPPTKAVAEMAQAMTIKQAGLRLEVAAAALNAAASGLSMGHIDNDAVDCGAMLSDLEDKRWQLDKARADFQRAIERATEIDAATLRRWMVL